MVLVRCLFSFVPFSLLFWLEARAEVYAAEQQRKVAALEHEVKAARAAAARAESDAQEAKRRDAQLIEEAQQVAEQYTGLVSSGPPVTK